MKCETFNCRAEEKAAGDVSAKLPIFSHKLLKFLINNAMHKKQRWDRATISKLLQEQRKK